MTACRPEPVDGRSGVEVVPRLAPAAVATDRGPDWPRAIAAALADPREPRLVFQPIADLRRGVVAGYEVLSRFSGPPHATPDVWFAEADRLGLGARLEAKVVRAAAASRATLPANCFLAVNLSPHLMCDAVLTDALTGLGDLGGLVLELTEHAEVVDDASLVSLLARLRDAGATVALDDVGSGYAGLRQLALVRPEMVKLDRGLVHHADADEAKLAAAELLGSYAGRLGAVLVAEGVERPEELEALAKLGTPLAQGWLFERPSPGWTSLAPGQGAAMRELARADDRRERVGSLLERTPVVHHDDIPRAMAHFASDAALRLVVVVDDHSRAVCLLQRPEDAGAPQVLDVSLRATVEEELVEVARRAMTRPERTRFDPVACSDADGAHRGILRPGRMVLRLTELASTSSADPGLVPLPPPSPHHRRSAP